MSQLEARINPKILQWARKDAGYDEYTLATELNRKTITVETIQNWEKGTAKPTYPTFKNLCKILKRPQALFFMSNIPDESYMDANFRHSVSVEELDKLQPKMRFLIRKAYIRQLNIAELFNQQAPPQIREFKKLPKENIASDDFIKKFREFLGITIEKQMAWKDSEEALKEWRKAIESKGIWIFKDPFRDCKQYSGFYLHNNDFPVIHLNNGESKNRQIFTLFHELGHCLLGKGGINFRENIEQKLPPEYRRDEVLCNNFAGNFLVPDLKIGNNVPIDYELEKSAKRYKVSKAVILRKYKDANIIDSNEYNERIEQWGIYEQNSYRDN